MSDPFQDLDAASPEVISMIVAGLETRAADPAMVPIVDDYLRALDLPEGGNLIDIGCGTGGVTRTIAARYNSGHVHGAEPSSALVAEAKKLGDGIANLDFSVGNGAALEHADNSYDAAILHTVLSHVLEPAKLIREARRILKPGGQLVICDADFSKAAIGVAEGDPLGACATGFVANNVTNPWLVGALQSLVRAEDLQIEHFKVLNRLVTEGMGCLIWVRMTSAKLVEDGVIGEAFAEALEAEYLRREGDGALYGFLPFANLVARKPAP